MQTSTVKPRGRASDTRKKVRELAIAWTRDGRPLSPTAILKELGGGSASTVCDELRIFREGQARALSAQDAADGTEDSSMVAQRPAAPPAPPVRRPVPAEEPVAAVLPADGTLAQQVAALAAELSKALARFDAAQRKMLVDVDQAREAARYWKEVAERAQAEGRAQLDSYRQAMYREMERANQLEGRLQQLLGKPLPVKG